MQNAKRKHSNNLQRTIFLFFSLGNTCEYKMYSESSMNGTITSPLYPAVYPKSSVCKYEFIGQKTEKIQVKLNC